MREIDFLVEKSRNVPRVFTVSHIAITHRSSDVVLHLARSLGRTPHADDRLTRSV
jgi:hypothetical protein